jgi:hypothetical protein
MRRFVLAPLTRERLDRRAGTVVPAVSARNTSGGGHKRARPAPAGQFDVTSGRLIFIGEAARRRIRDPFGVQPEVIGSLSKSRFHKGEPRKPKQNLLYYQSQT